MKLKRSTLILVGIAFLLGSGVLISEAQRSNPIGDTAEQTADQPLFDFNEEDVVALEIRRGGETLAFEQDDTGNWQMLRPEKSVAEPGAVAFLLSQLTSEETLQQVNMPPEEQGEFGFLAPKAQIELTLADGTKRTVVLGGEAFSGDALYALVDPKVVPLPQNAGETTVYVVSQNLANGVERPLAEWKMAVEDGDIEVNPQVLDDPTQAEDSDSTSETNGEATNREATNREESLSEPQEVNQEVNTEVNTEAETPTSPEDSIEASETEE